MKVARKECDKPDGLDEILAHIKRFRKIDAEGNGYDAAVEALEVIEKIVKRMKKHA